MQVNAILGWWCRHLENVSNNIHSISSDAFTEKKYAFKLMNTMGISNNIRMRKQLRDIPRRWDARETAGACQQER